MRVLQIVPKLDVGGVERGTIDWALALKAMGHTPIVVSGGGQGADYLKKAAIKHITLPVGVKRVRTLLLARTLSQLFTSLSVDIVHARSRLPAWLSYWAIKKMKTKPAFVTTLHGLHSVSFYATVMAKGDAVIAVSKTAAKYLESHYQKHLRKPPYVIYRGIELKDFPYGYKSEASWIQTIEHNHSEVVGKKKVLLPGRFSAIKGGMGLIPWLKSESAGGCVLMINAKPEESGFSRSFHKQLKINGLDHRVAWLGIERDMKQLYAYVDVVLSVNKKPESFGRTVLEALSIGTPVIAFNHGGVSEIMNELFPQGLIDFDDWSGFAVKVTGFLNDKPVVLPHHSFQLKDQLAQTLDVYLSVLRDR